MPPAHAPSSPGSSNSPVGQGHSGPIGAASGPLPEGGSGGGAPGAPGGTPTGAPAAAPGGAPGSAAAGTAGSTNDAIDALDGRLIRLLAEEPRIGVLECSRRLQVARGTVQARLDRLQSRG